MLHFHSPLFFVQQVLQTRLVAFRIFHMKALKLVEGCATLQTKNGNLLPRVKFSNSRL